MIYLSCKNQHKSTMNKSRISLLIALISLLIAVIATRFAFADEYSYIIAGGETQYEITKEKVTKVVQTHLPVGSNIATRNNERIFISAIASDEVNICYSRPDISGSGASTNTTAHFGRCKINSEMITRFDNTTPAIRIKLISVDMEQGIATLIVTKFWPYPNDTKTKEVDPPTNPEAEPVKP